MKALLYEVTGVIEASPDRVAELLAVRPGPIGPSNLWLLSSSPGTLSGGPERFTAQLGGYTMTVEARRGFVAMQGGWWYRGEYLVEPHPEGARLTHRVFNAAQWGRWAVPLANRLFIGFRANLRKSTGVVLKGIGNRLGCAVRLE